MKKSGVISLTFFCPHFEGVDRLSCPATFVNSIIYTTIILLGFYSNTY